MASDALQEDNKHKSKKVRAHPSKGDKPKKERKKADKPVQCNVVPDQVAAVDPKQINGDQVEQDAVKKQKRKKQKEESYVKVDVEAPSSVHEDIRELKIKRKKPKKSPGTAEAAGQPTGAADTNQTQPEASITPTAAEISNDAGKVGTESAIASPDIQAVSEVKSKKKRRGKGSPKPDSEGQKPAEISPQPLEAVVEASTGEEQLAETKKSRKKAKRKAEDDATGDASANSEEAPKKKKAKKNNFVQPGSSKLEGEVEPIQQPDSTAVETEAAGGLQEATPEGQTTATPEGKTSAAPNNELHQPKSSAAKRGTAAAAFQRVKADDWVGKQGAWDNSYNANFGDSGWGAKAQAVLGQVRGRDFRHEKTKKKRGSYRGGVIDDKITSIKFDSDEE